MIGSLIENSINNNQQDIQYYDNINIEDELNIEKEVNELFVQSFLIDSFLESILSFADIKNNLNEPTIKLMFKWFESIGILNQEPKYHEPEIDTKINKSLEVNIEGFKKSLEICKKFHDLSKKEKEQINEETDISINNLKRVTTKYPDYILQYNGLSLDELQKLYKGITNANDKLMKIKDILDFTGSLKVCEPTNIRKLNSQIENFSSDDIKNEVLKKNKGLEDFINQNKELFPYVGIGKLTFGQKTKLIHFTGCHPKYKEGLKDKDYQINLTKNQSLLLQLFKAKKDLFKYLDYVINSLKPIEDAISVLQNMAPGLKKLQEDDPKLYRLAMIGISLIRNYSRFYAVIDYKITKGTKYISRKIRLIQTRIKHIKI